MFVNTNKLKEILKQIFTIKNKKTINCMTFENMAQGENCKCLKNCTENTVDIFARRTDYTKELKSRDFKCDKDKKREFPNLNDCKAVCGYYGVSIDLWNENSKDILLKRYITTASFSPQHRKNLSIIKFKESAGFIKNTPINEQIGGEYHYDLYKCDNFEIEMIELIENIPLFENV
jgi:hypothetical protein